MDRTAKLERKTNETDIKINLDIDGTGKYNISTGMEFFDHMLSALARHGRFNLDIDAKGDLGVDDHHTVEDVGILLGNAFKEALGDKKGIRRMSHSIMPMDESLATVAIDISGRGYFVGDMFFECERVGTFSTANVEHFFESFAINSGININMFVEGENDHHQIEALFKGLARCLDDACRVVHDDIPSTKGVL